MDYFSLAIERLTDKGYKVTTPRKQVLKALHNLDKPASPYDIQKLIPVKPQLNHVTIYRILELLQQLHLVHKVSSGGFIKCVVPEEDGCHHFLICNSCGLTKEFAEAGHKHHVHLPESLDNEFILTNHTYELSGVCKKCQKI
jgi:Fe2+ or Zn2+ uptake regulation protein